MRRFVVCLLMSCAGLALAACSSAPTHFYTLLPSASTATSTRSVPYAIAVLPVTIPAAVDRPQMVVREGGSNVALLDGERWIARWETKSAAPSHWISCNGWAPGMSTPCRIPKTLRFTASR